MNSWKFGFFILSLCFGISAHAQFDPFPGNTVDCGFVCSPECDNGGGDGDDDDPFCELLGTCEPDDCDNTIQTCIDDGDDDGGCEGADCGDTDPCGGGTSNGNSNTPNGSTGNPINLISGNKYKNQIDLEPLPGQLGLEFGRHYNSAYSKSIGLGVGWRHSYSTVLSIRGGFAPGEMDVLRLQQSDGRILPFKRVGERKAGAQYKTRNHVDGYITTTEYGYQWRWRDGKVISFDDKGLMTQIAKHRQVLTLRYSSNGQLLRVIDPQGRRLTLHYDGRRLAGITDPSGEATQFKYDKEERLVNVVRPSGEIRLYHYQDKTNLWHLTGITDERGIRVQSYGYDEFGRAVVSTKDINTEKVAIDYDDENNRRILTDSQGDKTIYQLGVVNGQKVITEVRGPGCSVCQEGDVAYEYNDALQVTKSTHKNGRVTEYEYDIRGRTLAQYETTSIQQKRLIAAFEYQGASHSPSLISRPSIRPGALRKTELIYNEYAQITQITESGYSPATPLAFDSLVSQQDSFIEIARSTKLSYDARGNLTSIDGPIANIDDLIRLNYDDNNHVKQIRFPNGLTQKVLQYDSLGRPTKLQQGDQQAIEITYGKSGKPTRITRGELSVAYAYDEVGNLVEITDPHDRKLSINYDVANRVSRASYENGPGVEVGFDDENRLVQRKLLNANGGVLDTVSFLYDANDRLSETLSNDNSQRYEYGEDGELSKITSGEDYVTHVQKLSSGRLLNLTQPGDVLNVLHLDEQGETAGVTDANGNTTLRFKNDFGQVVRISSSDTGETYFAYDLAGNQIQKQTSSGALIQQEFDASNRLIKKTSSDGVTVYSYDGATGKLASIVNPQSREDFTFDIEGRLIAHLRTIDGNKFRTHYSFNTRGQLKEKVLPDGQVLMYHYYIDGLKRGELRAVTRKQWFGMSQTELLTELDSNKWDGSKIVNFGNGMTATRVFNDQGKLAQIKVGSTNQIRYEYDDNGRIGSVNYGDAQQTFRYDIKGRLVGAETPAGRYQYQYDKAGNRTQYGRFGGVNQTLSYGKKGQGNRLKQLNDGEYSYNPEGSTLQQPSIKGTRRYEYNAEQRPVKLFINDQLMAEYSYNGFGERIKKVVYSAGSKSGGKVTYFLYDGSNVSAEADASGEVLAQYIYYDKRPTIKLEGSTPYYIQSDHLGTPISVTDEDQSIVWAASYSPFGKAQIDTENIKLNLRFPGQYADQESGTHYNYYRDYDPETGRYQTSDPVGLAGGINTYAYVAGNPVSQFDVLGLMQGGGDEGTIVLSGVDKPIAISSATYLEKLEFVMVEAGKSLVGELKKEFENLLKPESLLVMAVMMGAITAAQAVPGLNVVIDTVLLGWAWWNFGSSAVDFLVTLIQVGVGIATADKRSELCALGSQFGVATAKVGLAATDIVSGGARRVNRSARNNNIDINVVPPRSRLRDVDLPDLPSGYTRSGNNIRGPRNGEYTYTNKDVGGHRVYENNGRYYTFVDGKKSPVRSPNTIGNHVVGLIGEQSVTRRLETDGWTPLGGTQRSNRSVEEALPGYQGQQGIDGIFKRTKSDGTTEYVIIETKASQGATTGSLNTTNDGTQLSKNWITNRVDAQVDAGTLSAADGAAIKAAQESGTLAVVKADVKNVSQGDANSGSVTFTEVTQTGDQGVSLGGDWTP